MTKAGLRLSALCPASSTGFFWHGTTAMTSSDTLHERLMKLETIVMHLQHDVELMNSAMLAQRGEIQALQSALERFQAQFAEAANEPEQRDPKDERPPHY
jgi:SlyX protein